MRGGPLSQVGGWGVVRGWVGGPVGGYNSPRETLGVHLGGLDVARGYACWLGLERLNLRLSNRSIALPTRKKHAEGMSYRP